VNGVSSSIPGADTLQHVDVNSARVQITYLDGFTVGYSGEEFIRIVTPIEYSKNAREAKFVAHVDVSPVSEPFVALDFRDLNPVDPVTGGNVEVDFNVAGDTVVVLSREELRRAVASMGRLLEETDI
jgi:hypothetical protein